MLVALLDVLDRKLHAALTLTDEKTEQAIRSVFATVGPDPNSPFVSRIIGPICDACERGYLERSSTARRVFEETIAPYKSEIGKGDIDALLKVAVKHFPPDKFVELVAETPRIFERRQAPSRKFQQETFDLHFLPMKAMAQSMSTKALDDIKLYLEELALHASSLRKPLWKRLLDASWRECARPAIGWVFSILAIVIAAYLVWILGVS